MNYCRRNGVICTRSGRLDFNSEGSLFLTNDGELSLRLTHPRFGVHKIYLATVEGRVETETLQRFTHGMWYQGEKFKAERARLVSASGAQSVVELTWPRANIGKCAGSLNRRAAR